MTSSIDYHSISSHVNSELTQLNVEKEDLNKQIENATRRLAQIAVREGKLARVADSLTDLLSLENMSAREISAARIDLKAETSIERISSPTDDNERIELNPEGGQEMNPEAFYQAATQADSSTDLVESGEFLEKEEKSEEESTVIVLPASQPETINEEAVEITAPAQRAESAAGRQVGNASVQADVSQLIDVPQTKMIRRPDHFDREDFYQEFPFLRGVQQRVHVLAARLLEYFGYGLKLSEIKDLILELGHIHNSQNFIDTVHTILKQKRKAGGEFRFNAADRIWELGYWDETHQRPEGISTAPGRRTKRTNTNGDTATAKPGDVSARSPKHASRQPKERQSEHQQNQPTRTARGTEGFGNIKSFENRRGKFNQKS